MTIINFDDPLLANIDLGVNEITFSMLSMQAQAVAESEAGAGRSLELRQTIKTKLLYGGFVYLNDSLMRSDMPLEISIRPSLPTSSSQEGLLVSTDGSYGRVDPRLAALGPNAVPWMPLTDEQYDLTSETGKIELNSVPVGGSEYDLSDRALSLVHPFTGAPIGNYLLKARYWSGYDFSPTGPDKDNPKVTAIKSAILGLMQALQSAKSGVKKFEVNDYYSIDVKSTSGTDALDVSLKIIRAIAGQ